ncbi:MAG: hypothetical protein R3C49_21380 [Planctomycetaceae bacterium]
MPRVAFTRNLQRHVDCPVVEVAGRTVREALDNVFAGNLLLRGYVLDDQGSLRTHMVIFIDAATLKDRQHLSDPVSDDSEIFVMQALSGG